MTQLERTIRQFKKAERRAFYEFVKACDHLGTQQAAAHYSVVIGANQVRQWLFERVQLRQLSARSQKTRPSLEASFSL